MDLLQKIQEKYIAEFSNNVPFDEFLFNLLVTAVLAVLLRWFYIRYGLAVSNRRRFGNNFLPLALGTLLIIMIVKSSIALSLGLVGALSIVRFRAAIKDPEELTFLFIAIGLGLAGGANQPILGAVAFVAIMILLYLHHLTTRRPSLRVGNSPLRAASYAAVRPRPRTAAVCSTVIVAIPARSSSGKRLRSSMSGPPQ